MTKRGDRRTRAYTILGKYVGCLAVELRYLLNWHFSNLELPPLSLIVNNSMHEVVSLSSPSGSSSKGSAAYISRSPRTHAQQFSDSPSLSRSSHDTDDSLRALELSDGPINLSTRTSRPRSFSMTGFDYEQDLLPLSSSLDDPVVSGGGLHSERSINLVSGKYLQSSITLAHPSILLTTTRHRPHCWTTGEYRASYSSHVITTCL